MIYQVSFLYDMRENSGSIVLKSTTMQGDIVKLLNQYNLSLNMWQYLCVRGGFSFKKAGIGERLKSRYVTALRLKTSVVLTNCIVS